MESFVGLEENRILSVMLGGSHSKGLTNSRSDVDLIAYYSTNVRNLLRFNRTTLSLVPKGFAQVSSDPVLYEHDGLKYELLMVPVRRVGEGNDLFSNLHKGNMKTIHELFKDYELLRLREFDDLIVALGDPDRFDLSVEAAVGYFHGYMTSQLMSHRRRADYEKRELKAYREHDINPVVKAIMNGMYIGLSGLLLLDARSVHRDFGALWRMYSNRFSDEQSDFVEECYLHKIDSRQIVGNVEAFLQRSAVMRDAIFQRMRDEFVLSKDAALVAGRFLADVDHKKNNRLLDEFQFRMLGA